jgi:hypothetical protein
LTEEGAVSGTTREIATRRPACPVANNYKTNSGPPTITLALSAFTPYGTTTDTYIPKIHTTSNPAEA